MVSGVRWDVLARIHAGWLLGTSLLVTLLRRLFGRPYGLALFHRNFREDRLLPLTTEEHVALPSISACIACGRCDEGDARPAPPHWRGMMAFMLSASRSMPDYEASAGMVQRFDDDVLARLEGRCPVRIPFRRVASLVRGYAFRLER